jgi:hypothetical protein
MRCDSEAPAMATAVVPAIFLSALRREDLFMFKVIGVKHYLKDLLSRNPRLLKLHFQFNFASCFDKKCNKNIYLSEDVFDQKKASKKIDSISIRFLFTRDRLKQKIQPIQVFMALN